jgi:hypothetical protein
MQPVDADRLETLVEEYQQMGLPTHDLEEQLRRMRTGVFQKANAKLEVKEDDLGDGRKRVRFSFAPVGPDIEPQIQARVVRRKR